MLGQHLWGPYLADPSVPVALSGWATAARPLVAHQERPSERARAREVVLAVGPTDVPFGTVAPTPEIPGFEWRIPSEQAKHGDELRAVVRSVGHQVKHLRDATIQVQEPCGVGIIDRFQEGFRKLHIPL